MGIMYIFILLVGITLFFTILFAIKKAVEEVLHYSKRDITIELNLEEVEVSRDKK